MSQPDSGNQNRQSDMKPSGGAMPSAGKTRRVPPPLPRSRKSRRLAPVAIAAICAAGLAMLLARGMFVPARAGGAREIKPEAGLTYTNDRVASEPWSIHVLKIDRSRKDLAFFSAHARDKVLGVSLIADQARAVPREIGAALAGINGDFYVRDSPPYSGDPRGLQIVNGDLISAPDTVCIWFATNGNPRPKDAEG